MRPFYSIRLLSWILLSGVFFILSLGQPLGIFGDGLEYIVQTQSFVFDKSISIDTTKRASFFNETNPYGIFLTAPSNPAQISTEFTPSERSQAGGRFGSLYPTKYGEYLYIHSWMYSLLCAPIYLLLNLISALEPSLSFIPSQIEYRSFQLFNSMLLSAAIVLGVRSILGVIVAFLLVLSPLGGYISWSTPEIFQFALLAIAFFLANKNGRFLPAILVGTAGAQNFPTLAFFLPLLLFQISKSVTYESFKANQILPLLIRLAPVYTFASVIGALPWIYFQLNFGTPNLIISLGQASITNCSFERFISFLFSPLAGAFWFFPVYFLLTPIVFFKRETSSRLNSIAKVILILLTFFLCFSMTGMSNLHSQQLGCPRYAAWIFGPLAGVLFSLESLKFKLGRSVALFGSFASLLIICFYSNALFLFAKHPRTDYLGIFPEQAKTLYRELNLNEDPEILVEALRRKELIYPWEFDSRYEIPLGDNQALCLVSLRSVQRRKHDFLPEEAICRNLEIPSLDSKLWKRSPVLGSYFLKKITKS